MDISASRYTARWPLRDKALRIYTDYKIIRENEALSLENDVFDGTMCRMRRWSFWSLFDVNQSTFDVDISKNDFNIFVPWPLDLKFAP